MSMQMNDLKIFIETAKSLNFTRASEICGITQPTLSYSIKRLENELGAALFIRLKNGVQLTKLGENFSHRVNKLIFEWEELEKLSGTGTNTFSGNYTIGAHPSVALYTLEHFLPDLNEKYPNIHFSLLHAHSREITEKIISWEIDFGLVINPKRHPDLIIKELCTDRVGVYASTDKKRDTLICDESLMQTQSILKKMEKAKLHFSKKISSTNLEVIAKLASSGLGFAILPERVARQYRNLKLITDDFFFQDKACLIYRSEKHKDPPGKAIIAKIMQGKY